MLVLSYLLHFLGDRASKWKHVPFLIKETPQKPLKARLLKARWPEPTHTVLHSCKGGWDM